MEKLFYKILSFVIVIVLVIAVFDECVGYVKGTAHDILENLLSPLKSCSADDDATEDLDKADPVTFKYLVIAQMKKQEIEINNISISNTNIKQEISPVNVLVNNSNQTITHQNKYINQTNINQTTLIQWVEQNNSNISQLETQYNYLVSRIDNLKSEIDGLKKQINSLKEAIIRKHYDKDNSMIMDKDNFEKMKSELQKDIQKLLDKFGALNGELKNNQSLILELKQTIDKCIHNIEEINKKMDELISKKAKTYYFIIDTEEELVSKNIISKGNLFNGLKVSANPNKDYFILLTENSKSIPLGSQDDKFEIMSDMPANSYEIRIVNKIKVLVIKDVKSFWSKTVFLIVLKK